jgi:hypothetical protein
MAVRTKVEPLDRDIALILNQELGPQARSAIIAKHAREALREGQEKNRRALGRTPPHKTFVDGQQGKEPEQVRPDGKIVFEFELFDEMLGWIGEQLVLHSPVLSGRFARSFILLADGSETRLGQKAPLASEYVFINTQPYARKLEREYGLFEAVAALGRKRFGNMAKINFSYQAWGGGRRGRRSDNRTPAVLISVRDGK